MAPRLIEGFLGAVLLIAAIAKTADLEATRSAVARLGLRPELAVPVIGAEAGAAVALLLGIAPAAATTAAVGLGVAFVVLQLRAEEAGGCGCLGSFDRNVSRRAGLTRAGVFLAVAVAAWALRLTAGTLDFGLRPSDLLVAVGGSVLAVVTLLVSSSILARLDRLPRHA